MKKKIWFILKLLFVLLTLLLIYHKLFVKEENWIGTYYIKGNISGNAIFSPRFTNKEECIAWAINERALKLEDKDVPLQDLWECNNNCRLAPEYTTLIHSSQEFKQGLLDNNMRSLYNCDNEGFDGGDWFRGDF